MQLGLRVSHWLPLALLVAATGCGGASYNTASVSGVVTLDGKPLPNASVSFVPVGTEAVNTTGQGSYGKTDESGRYTLKLIENDGDGAAVGQHKVSISAPQGDASTEGTVITDLVPARYQGAESVLTFEVVPGGTKEANFALNSTAAGS